MKKTLLSIAFVAMGIVAFAQKPSAGNITTEIGLSSLLGAPVGPGTSNLAGFPMFRVRYFLAEDMAIRANLGVGMTSTVTKTTSGAGSSLVTAEQTAKTTGFGIAVGIEKHMAGSSKLSPYVGAEFGFLSQSGTVERTNAISPEGSGPATIVGDKYSQEGGGVTTIAFNGLLGADYYVADNVYFGAEVGIGLFMSQSTSDLKVTVTNAGATASVTGTGPKNSSYALAPNVMGIIRLGIILF